MTKVAHFVRVRTVLAALFDLLRCRPPAKSSDAPGIPVYTGVAAGDGNSVYTKILKNHLKIVKNNILGEKI